MVLTLHRPIYRFVIEILDKLWYHFSVRFRFKAESFALLIKEKKKKKKPVKTLIHPNHIYKMHNLHTHWIYLRVWREGMSIMLVNKVVISKTREENLLVKC